MYEEGLFDNRWYVFASDFPTAAKFREMEIRHLLVVCTFLNEDVRDALVEHADLAPELLDPDSKVRRPLPPARSRVVRGVSAVGRFLGRNLDGTFGRPISHG